jgi:hypothetical protein
VLRGGSLGREREAIYCALSRSRRQNCPNQMCCNVDETGINKNGDRYWLYIVYGFYKSLRNFFKANIPYQE